MFFAMAVKYFTPVRSISDFRKLRESDCKSSYLLRGSIGSSNTIIEVVAVDIDHGPSIGGLGVFPRFSDIF
uniref:Uncharacterized protein n=1 Tax=Candidatus Kentrum sp. FW TaxID=2126338 RepID=A0A450S5J5_9GAMM|nr:MAG: hypothetical protein BECKFW1821A_GA0114235_101512 [Candidatus Kentron sp. FW]